MTTSQQDVQNSNDSKHGARGFEIQIGNEELSFHSAFIEDPVPTGRQIIDLGDFRPALDYQVFQVLKNGLMENIRPDETVDLRATEIEKFLIFRSDGSFRFELDGDEFQWGARLITGLTLKKLAKVDLVRYGVWLEVPRGDDVPIADTDLFDVSKPGVERFFTGIVKTTEGGAPC
ncbi:hypothetical protein BSG18_30120 [Pseudomonas ogarae]|uniref:multiubiquitin domain-containing protein n=1 Tax=Pseudomonas ogarae (strain DSM 112162 / CECT 30235 / F113) TaxID=1114970 RepID=UPI000BB37E23|nr:multiubiquitin domain-containing protein [Pseudomonas ogarae]PBJ21582.1 hypothetical protein BSG18_30120 [Pseudomonas ogarae]